MNSARLEEQLILHEGLRLRPYKDTVGKTTIGVGYNLSDRGPGPLEEAIGRKFDGTLTRDEALLALRADIRHTEEECRRRLACYDRLDGIRQRVCIDMAFNMGYKALRFEKTIAAVASGDYGRAAHMMLQSRWAEQVKGRAARLAAMMRTGRDYQS